MLVSDVLRTIAFYRDVLGFEVVVAGPPADRPAWALLRRGTADVFVQARHVLADALPLPPPGPGDVTLYLDTEGVEALYERVRPRAPVVRDLHVPYDGARAFAVRDPDGAVVVFGEAVREAGARAA